MATDLREKLKSLSSFLAIPLAVVLFFLLAAYGVYQLDSALSQEEINGPWLQFLRDMLGDHQSVRSLLSTIATALITVTSITFSLLLVAVQQAAASFSNQILQQFRHRRTNQFYFGFFVGVSLYTLITLAATRDNHYPLFGALVAILLTIAALLIILVLIYTTIEQMRASSVIHQITVNIREARKNERKLLECTRRTETEGLPTRLLHVATEAGDVVHVEVDRLSEALEQHAPGGEILLRATDGVYVGRGDPIAEVRSAKEVSAHNLAKLDSVMRECIRVGAEPQLEANPQVGIAQLATIAWNNTSTAVSNPHPPVLICRAVRELVWEWSDEAPIGDPTSPIVYPDMSLKRGLELLEAVGVASAESKQPQTLAELYDAYSALLPKVEPRFRKQIEEAVRLSLGAIPNHPPTQHLNQAMERLAEVLRDIGSQVGDLVDKVLQDELEHAAFRNEVSLAKPQ